MAKTAAERQAACQARRLDGVSGGARDRRMNAWISASAHYALRRLAKRYGVTQREMIGTRQSRRWQEAKTAASWQEWSMMSASAREALRSNGG